MIYKSKEYKVYHREYQKKWNKLHPNKCKEYYKKHRNKMLRCHRILRQKHRLQCLIHYGGNPPKCSCCNENHLEFLAIDHIEGNGNKHRKSSGKPSHFFKWLIDNNFPKGFRVLCHNCNCSLGFYGYCPHNLKEVLINDNITKK